MIVTNHELQTIACTVCRVVVEIPRRCMSDPWLVTAAAEEIERDHRECAEHADNPSMARLHRRFRKNMEREMKRAMAKAKGSAQAWPPTAPSPPQTGVGGF